MGVLDAIAGNLFRYGAGWLWYRTVAAAAPERLFSRASRLTEALGVVTPAFLLSFDCDAPEDIDSACELDGQLRAMGLKPAYAVPGELLHRGAGVFRRMRENGAEFLNHGYVQHVRWNPASCVYESHFFYDRLPWEDVERDVRAGHQACCEVLGVEPSGFRTPHFGTFQTWTSLGRLHRLLQTMGYSYSSSTGPLYGFRFGPLFRTFGLVEMPLSGTFSRPLRLLDSWGWFKAPERSGSPEEFYYEIAALAGHLKRTGQTLVLNYYADPSHVLGSEAFMRGMRALLSVAQPASFREVSQRCPPAWSQRRASLAT
jgi:hypothetical protein